MFGHIHRTVKNDFDPVMRYNVRDQAFVIAKYDPASKQSEFVRVTSDMPILLDFGWVRHGWERLKKGMTYDIHICNVYRNGGVDPTHIPIRMSDDYEMVGVMQAIVKGHGRVRLIADNDIINSLLTEFYNETFTVADEARSGLIPLVTINHLTFAIVKWVERDEKYLGQRNLPKPKTQAAQTTQDEHDDYLR